MPVVAPGSAKGSPGVSTFAVVCTQMLGRGTVLVDADPHGSDLLHGLVRSDGRALDAALGLVSLRPWDADEALMDHVQRVDGRLPVVVGCEGPGHPAGRGPDWRRAQPGRS